MDNTLEKELQRAIQGEVRCDAVSRKVYSVDASIYEVEPIVIVLPKTIQDIQTTVRIAADRKIPIIPRGAATGITGGCIGRGIVIDMSKYLNRILDVNPEQQYAIVEPGVVQDHLNEAVNSFGLRLGPETSTGNRATLGGMLANNAAGAHSLRYGKMVDHILETELLLSEGTILSFTQISQAAWQEKSHAPSIEGNIYRTVKQIGTTYKQDIEKHFPKISRRVSGYNLDETLTHSINISKLIAGSEGTLGICTQMKVSLVPVPKHKALLILHFNTLTSAFEAVELILRHDPYSLEMIDQTILSLGKQAPLVKDRLSWLQGSPEAVLVVECEGNTSTEVEEKILRLTRERISSTVTLIDNPSKMNDVWAVRKAGLEILLSKRSYTRAVAFIEDIALSPHQLAPFMNLLLPLLEKSGAHAGIYGHVGAGCIHVRPYLDLRQEKDRKICRELMEQVSDLVLKFHGAMSGEHGDGLVRSWLNEKMFGKTLMRAFRELKKAFDPQNLMNPGKIIPETQEDFLHDLRKHPEKEIGTFLDFQKEGGFSLSVDLCNGNGSCRKPTGTMCPSFQATGDEYDTTRARAQALRGMIDGTYPPNHEIAQVLDLCLECKGCKKECPVQVDMAKMKAEFLYQYHQKTPHSLRSRLFAYLPIINQWTSIVRLMQNLPFQKQTLSLLGISPQRKLPHIQKELFSQWWKKHQRRTGSRKVVLFNDTFNEYYAPHIGRSAVQVLEKLGYEVIVPPFSCCGRTFFSKGFLEKARECALTLVEQLFPYLEQKIPIVGLEPSCILTLRDDYPSLLGNDQQGAAVAEAALPIDAFLHDQEEIERHFSRISHRVHVHGHCHQKAIIGMKPTMDLMSAVSENVTEIPSGCCGMAGSFGYEQEHFDISQKIASLVLIPHVKEACAEEIIIANGFSCRTQIHDFTGRKALHMIELLEKQILAE